MEHKKRANMSEVEILGRNTTQNIKDLQRGQFHFGLHEKVGYYLVFCIKVMLYNISELTTVNKQVMFKTQNTFSILMPPIKQKQTLKT